MATNQTFRPRAEGESMEAYLKAKQGTVGTQQQDPFSLSKGGQYYKEGNDVKEAGTGRTISLDEFQRLGLNFALLPEVEPQTIQQAGQETQTGKEQYITGDPTLDAILKQNQQFLETMKQQGKVLNPSVEITPGMLKQFHEQSSTEIDPYYSSQIKSIKNDLYSSLDNLQKSYDESKANLESRFKESLGLRRESEAGAGTTFSGGRARREQVLAGETQRSLSSLAASTLSSAKAAGVEAERTAGSLGISGITTPQIQTGEVSTLGKGAITPTGYSSLYAPTGDTIGSLERERMTIQKTRESQLKEEEIRRQLNYYS